MEVLPDGGCAQICNLATELLVREDAHLGISRNSKVGGIAPTYLASFDIQELTPMVRMCASCIETFCRRGNISSVSALMTAKSMEVTDCCIADDGGEKQL